MRWMLKLTLTDCKRQQPVFAFSSFSLHKSEREVYYNKDFAEIECEYMKLS